MSIFRNHLPIMGASGAQSTGYTIDQSIRFNDDDSAYMHRTPSGAGDRRTFTYSVWFKLGDMASTQRMFLSVRNSDTTRDNIMFNQGSAGDFRLYFDARVSGSAHTVLEPTRALRDPSAWYHLIVAVDTTSPIITERVKLYLNGERETAFTNETYPSLNQQFQINNTDKHSIGRFEFSSPSGYWDGYLAEIHLIDGNAYGPEFFGEFNSSNIWIPKEYTGSYGTNGFKIDGRDSSDLGDDESGNGNDFTTSGLAAHDQVADSPTNNFAVINAVYSTRTTSGAGSSHTLENGNLFQQADSYSSSNYGTRPFTVQPLNRGKWYFEFEGNTEAGGGNLVHVAISEESAFYVAQGTQSTNRYGLYLESGSAMYVLYPGASRQETNAPIAQYTKIIGCATDFDNAKMYFFVDGTEIHGQDISAGTAASNLSGWSTSSNWIFHFATVTASNNSARSNIIFNFGQEGTFAGTQTAGGNSDGNGIGNFKHSVPSGYLALCTSNLGS
mgnify:CR=1 FL=1